MTQNTQNTQEIYCKVAGYEEKFPQSFLLKCQGEGIWFTDEDNFCPNPELNWSFNGGFTYHPCNKKAFAKAVTEFKGEPDRIIISLQQFKMMFLLATVSYTELYANTHKQLDKVNELIDSYEKKFGSEPLSKEEYDNFLPNLKELLKT